MNLLHQLPPGPDFPNVIYVIVEVPKGSRNKYEYDKKRGMVEVYKELEGVPTEVLGWERATAAREQIVYAVELYRSTFGEPSEPAEE